MKKHVIIVAGGKGTRMKSDLPKQFILLDGKPILMHTIQRFYDFDASMNIVVVLPKNQITYWKDCCEAHNFKIKHEIAIGGAERFDSVKHGLAFVFGDGIVGIHDGVRPLVSNATLKLVYNTAAEKGNATPIMPMVDSIRKVADESSQIVDREALVRVQTPQCFDVNLIKAAYNVKYSPTFTDDSSVLEAAGHTVNLVNGNPENIKITNPFDLDLAKFFLNHS